MHQMVGGYLAKRIGDELFAPPRPESKEAGPAPSAEPGPPDEVEITDERGRPLGTAYRLPGVAVYVVSDEFSYHQDDLRGCLADPQGRRFILSQDGRIAGIVYAPHQRRRRERVEALRAEDV